MQVTLLLGDCAAKLEEIPSESVDLVVTSPPYDNLRDYKGYSFEFEKIAGELYRIIKKGGVIVWVVGDASIEGSETCTSFRQAIYFKELGLNLHDTMLFMKSNYIPLNHNRYEQSFEYMFVFSKGKPKTFNPIKIECATAGKVSSNKKFFQSASDSEMTSAHTEGPVREYKIKANNWVYTVGTNKTGHPAPFPLDLARDHIISWSNEGDTVLDPFLGSGTTGVAASLLDRHFNRN